MCVLRGIDVEIETNCIWFFLMKTIEGVFYDSCFADSSRRDKCHVSTILQMGYNIPCLSLTVTKVCRAFVALIYEGIV